MSSGLSKVGVIWALASFLSATAASVGFYLPFWLQGWMRDEHVTPVYFGVFRRCNYPKLMKTGLIKVVEECGRYTTFYDIPSMSWQIAAVLVGVGCGIAILVSFTALLAMCIKDIFSETAVRVAGVVQLLAGLLIGAGIAIYPNGWDSIEVQQACGHASASYRMGGCQLSWAFYLTAGGAAVTMICAALSCGASKEKTFAYHV
ncbi:LHFPL tetraspan subfamily member 6 protein-like [Liolophura sinensis]|uniref:LHFPL tetraspan subfamily member 6 protein-like n=1 Tax=Liolophura sinensis TaxID=3198878 RepID=UPI00315820C2